MGKVLCCITATWFPDIPTTSRQLARSAMESPCVRSTSCLDSSPVKRGQPYTKEGGREGGREERKEEGKEERRGRGKGEGQIIRCKLPRERYV